MRAQSQQFCAVLANHLRWCKELHQNNVAQVIQDLEDYQTTMAMNLSNVIARLNEYVKKGSQQDYAISTRVRMHFDDGEWYTGTVIKFHAPDNEYSVEFEDGHVQKTKIPDKDVKLIQEDKGASDIMSPNEQATPDADHTSGGGGGGGGGKKACGGGILELGSTSRGGAGGRAGGAGGGSGDREGGGGWEAQGGAKTHCLTNIRSGASGSGGGGSAGGGGDGARATGRREQAPSYHATDTKVLHTAMSLKRVAREYNFHDMDALIALNVAEWEGVPKPVGKDSILVCIVL